MKIIIYITALICSLLASPALATETRQISMTNMGLKVTSSPESTLRRRYLDDNSKEQL